MRSRLLALCAVLLPLSACASAPELKGQWTQGAGIIGRADPGAKVSFNGRALHVSPSGWFVFGLSRDETAPAELSVTPLAGKTEVFHYEIKPREYAIQKIDGLPQAMVTPPAKALKQIEQDNKRIGAARARDSAREDFAHGLVWPATGPLTGFYGSQRILNGEPRQPHFGVDIAAGQGSPVKATAAGVVAMARSDVYFTGGTIILDHGQGLSSTYLHLSRLDVKEGDMVEQGQVIGAVGMTGRATGPHLCFRINWFDVRLDPQLMLPEAEKVSE